MKSLILKSLSHAVMLVIIAISLLSCNSGEIQNESSEEKPLNISIYLDLSDRLLKSGTPDQKEKDLAIVDAVSDLFKDATIGPQILKSKNKMKIFFYPAPQDEKISVLAENLSIDVGKLKGIDKRVETENLKDKLHNSLSEIYDLTLEEGNWVGSDIWGFFSDSTKIDVQCIDKDARNVIIILTDGFLFHVNSKKKEGNAYSYVLRQTLAVPGSSLIVERGDLENIEVLMLEIAPTGENLNLAQKTKMKEVLTDWFREMGVKHFQIAETDVSANTKTIIENFINQ